MRIGIHDSPGSFSDRWISYCTNNKIDFKLVDCTQSNIVQELEDCDILMWHHNHANPKDVLVAQAILNALSHSGKVIFPDFKSGWHFDDKVAQKYLFEALRLPAVKAEVFLNKSAAKKWINGASLPVVFKLRRGAGSRNVKLITTHKEAKRIISIAFGKGFRQFDAWGGIKESFRKFRTGQHSVKDVIKSFAHLVYPIKLEKSLGREKGYVYFQEFIPDNLHDIRVVVVQGRAFAIKRKIREGDFRASGSGMLEYDKSNFSDKVIQISFDAARRIGSSCLAFDFVIKDGSPLIVEISYGFSIKAYDLCVGYWSEDLTWHDEKVKACDWMIEAAIMNYKAKNDNR